MFRVLVVEDIESVLNRLATELQSAFLAPEGETLLKVYPAKSVKDGLTLIDEGHARNRPFHAAVLDFKLPQSAGEDAKMDESLCLAIKRKMPNALVVHITSHSTDPFVANHINIYHLGGRGAEAEVLPKKAEWPTKLEAILKKFLYGTRIEQQLDRLFGADSAITPYSSRTAFLPSRSQGERSLTHALATLAREIEEHWVDLDEGLQTRIKAIFRVDTYDDSVRVSLINPEKVE